MNICFFMHHSISNKDGASLSLKNVCEELVKRGHTVHVVYPSLTQYNQALSNVTKNYFIRSYSMRIKIDERIDKKIEYIPKIFLNKIASYNAYRVLKEKKIDIIHINGLDNEVGALTAKKLNVPYVWHIRSFLNEDLGLTLFNKKNILDLLKKSDRIIGISKAICEKFKSKLNTDVDLIYNGVPINDYIIKDNHAFKDTNVRNIILPGRITDKKGQMDAVKAVKILRDRGKRVNLKLVGYGVDSYYNRIIEYISNNNLCDLITISPYCDNLIELRKNSDIGLITSKYEAFGRVTIENFLAKILCIGTNKAGTLELINNNYGLLYEQGNEFDLADKIEFAIDSNNIDLINNYIDEAFNYSVNMFSIGRVVDEIESIYEKVLN